MWIDPSQTDPAAQVCKDSDIREDVRKLFQRRVPTGN